MKTYLELFTECLKGKWITSGKDVQYKVVDKVLYFQQSASLSDWKLNFDIAVVPYKNMKEIFFVHRGFLKAWKSVRDEIAKLDFDIIFGVSLGGAITILAHDDFLYRKGKQPVSIVVGCPKVLFMPSKSIRKRFTKVTRIENVEDLVCELPLLYSRVGKEVLLYSQVKNPGRPFWEWLSGHSPAMYKARL